MVLYQGLRGWMNCQEQPGPLGPSFLCSWDSITVTSGTRKRSSYLPFREDCNNIHQIGKELKILRLFQPYTSQQRCHFFRAFRQIFYSLTSEHLNRHICKHGYVPDYMTSNWALLYATLLKYLSGLFSLSSSLAFDSTKRHPFDDVFT